MMDKKVDNPITGNASAPNDKKTGGENHEDHMEKLQRQLSELLVSEKSDTNWDDIVGAPEAKESLKEVIVLPLKYPKLFTGKPRWGGVLLYGAPGVGKSLLLKAAASEANSANLYIVRGSDLMSRWRDPEGGERILKPLYDLARLSKPAVVVIDEIDLVCKADNQSESLRKIKTELLCQMQGCGTANDRVVTVGITNAPWLLDNVFRRRCGKTIYVPLPDEDERAGLFKKTLRETSIQATDEDFKTLARMSDGFTGADITVVAREAMMMRVRRVQVATHFKKVRGPSPMDKSLLQDDMLTPCSAEDSGAMKMTWEHVPENKMLEPVVTMDDVVHCLRAARPSISQDEVNKFQEFSQNFA